MQQVQEAPAGSEVQQVPDTYPERSLVYEEGVSGVRADVKEENDNEETDAGRMGELAFKGDRVLHWEETRASKRGAVESRNGFRARMGQSGATLVQYGEAECGYLNIEESEPICSIEV